MSNQVLVLNIILQLMQQATEAAKLLRQAQSEGRDVSKEELDALAQKDDEVRQKLAEAIAQAGG